MSIDMAKELVLKAGMKIMESGLIAGTWGNVSCRIDDKYFAVTPSGRNYDTLTPDDIVVVNISNGSYSGNIKPSSEKSVHAGIYELFPDVNFIIHTHQEYASILSASSIEKIRLEKNYPYIGSEIPFADYALPGTDALKNNVLKALRESNTKAIILKNHGVICLGTDYEETFSIAFELEKACKDLIINRYSKLSGKKIFDIEEIINFSINNANEDTASKIEITYTNCTRAENGILAYGNNAGFKSIETFEPGMPDEIKIYYGIFKKHNDLKNIQLVNTPIIEALCHHDTELKPLLDDFAQIAGTGAKIVPFNEDSIVDALSESLVVLVKNVGALCCGRNESEANIVAILTQKNCKAYVGASLFGVLNFISSTECRKMYYNYINNYSKLNKVNK